MSTITVTEADFDQKVLQSELPVLVDFWAEWCGPCKAVAPLLDEIAKDYAGKLTVAKMDIDENPVTPNEYAVLGIPTMLLFRDGKLLDQKVGAMPRSARLARSTGNGHLRPFTSRMRSLMPQYSAANGA